MILAQLGLFGTIAYVLLLFGILLGLNTRARKSGNLYIRLATLFYAVNVLVSSIQSNYPGNNSMCMLTFIVTLMPFAASAAGLESAAATGPEAHNGN
jgi:O-antigen ligase